MTLPSTNPVTPTNSVPNTTSQSAFNLARDFPAPVLGHIVNHLSPSDALQFSRTSPYIAPSAMAHPHEAARVNVLKQYREPQSIALVQSRLGTAITNNLLQVESPLTIEQSLEMDFQHGKDVLLQGPTLPVSTATFNQFNQLTSGDSQGRVSLWSPSTTGWESTTLQAQQREVQSIDTSADGNTVINAGWDDEVRLHQRTEDGQWQTTTLFNINEDLGARWYKPQVALSPQANYATATCYSYPQTFVFPTNEHSALPAGAAHPQANNSVSFSSDERVIATVPYFVPLFGNAPATQLFIWTKTDDPLAPWQSTEISNADDPIKKAEVSANGLRVVGASENSITIMDRDGNDQWQRQTLPNQKLVCAKLDIATPLMVSRDTMSGAINVWKPDPLGQWSAHTLPKSENINRFASVDVSPQGQFICVSRDRQAGTTNRMGIWRQSNNNTWQATTLDKFRRPSIEFSPDERHALVKGSVHDHVPYDEQDRVHLLRIEPGSNTWQRTPIKGDNWQAESASFNRDGSAIAIVDSQQNLRVLTKGI